MPDSSSVGQRFSQLIQQLGMSKNAFAMSLDKTATVIQHLVDERNKPGFDLMCKVFEVYPNVSKDWLLLGKGSMLLDSTIVTPLPEAQEVVMPTTQARPSIAAVASTAPSFPAPLFTVSTARSSVPDIPTLPTELLSSTPPDVTTSVSPPAVAPALGAAPPEPQPVAPALPSVPNPVVSAAAATPPASLDATALTAALHAQYLQHQLALAEQRNQHLLEQQKLMQQMIDLMRRPA